MVIMGVDVGGSGIKGVPVDLETGELVGERFRLPTPEKAKPGGVAETIAQVVQNFDYTGPIGCGFPAVVRGGIVYTAANIHKSWLETDVEALLREATGCPVYVINDADAAGLAEMRYGVGRQYQQGVVIMVTIGTGLGTALFVDGKLVPNTELGHIEIRGKDAEKRASDAARQKKDLSWGEWGVKFSEYLNYLERLFWPDLFILGGGASKSLQKFAPSLQVKTKVVAAELLNQAGIVGAALYAAQRSGELAV
ncbi:MAG: ROK family protein [Chloroflexi bacterium]|nr:ROK family protein [Chloroflexota bacterium]